MRIASNSRTGAIVTESTVVAIAALGFGFLFSYPLLPHLGEKTQVLDWTRGLEWAWANWTTITRFHQLPLWNPYKCGGLPALANPQSHWMTPFMLLHLMFGPYVGLQLEIPLHLAVAFAGAYLMARVIGCRPLAATAAALCYAGSSWLPLHAAAGHEVFLPGAYIPWSCALVWMSFSKRRLTLAAAAGAVIALTFFEGGVYDVLQTMVLLAVVCLVAAMVSDSLWPLLSAVVSGLFAAGFAAIKLGPSLHEMAVRPRRGYVDWVGPYETVVSIFSRTQTLAGPLGKGGFWEHGAYIGIVFAGFALCASMLAMRKTTPWLAAGIIFFVLALGGTSPLSPYAIWHRMPFVGSTYAPSRNLIALTLCVAVMAALGVQALLEHKNTSRNVVIGLLVFGFVDLLIVSPISLGEAFTGQVAVAAMPYSPQFRQYRDTNSSTGMLALNLSNLGAANCWETNFIDYSENPVLGFNQPGYRGEQYLVGAGIVRIERWTPEALTYDVNATGSGLLVINQVYDDGWRVEGGTGAVIDHDGLLAVPVGAGRHRVRIIYRGKYFTVGLWLSLVTTIVFGILWSWERRVRLHRIAASSSRSEQREAEPRRIAAQG